MGKFSLPEGKEEAPKKKDADIRVFVTREMRNLRDQMKRQNAAIRRLETQIGNAGKTWLGAEPARPVLKRAAGREDAEEQVKNWFTFSPTGRARIGASGSPM